MNNGQQSQIPIDISAYLDEIAERLWSVPGHAAVMVGAGFSKNAICDSRSTGRFPDWNELGNAFYEKIHGPGSQPRMDEHFIDVLKLADEVQAAFGRPALDQMIKSLIPNKEYRPSLLHAKLLDLPWVDIFTTNYDTLLERAQASITSRKFDVVVNKRDLVYSERPRIIKLHGSLPSDGPFIITEEDYRTYPKEFAPFVNTVQQSLLENTLCLVGFSGDDPNFLRWTGWIRDNLGEKNQPKIYMVGAFNLSDAKRKLLEQSNINLVDMSRCSDVGQNHSKGLEVFLNYLASQKKDNSLLEWPDDALPLYPNPQKPILPQIKEMVPEWTRQRNIFPNWALVPEDRRNTLWLHTENWLNGRWLLEVEEIPLDIRFLYELNWRLEMSLCPILDVLVPGYEAIIARYDPFPEILKNEGASIRPDNPSFGNLLWEEIRGKWLDLNVALMRYYREEGLIEKWSAIRNRLEVLVTFLSSELLARYHYERCLHALFSFDIHRLESELQGWPTNSNLPFWEAKRASLMAELGNTKGAEQILENALERVRSQLNLVPVTNDYSFVSQESHIMLLVRYVRDVVRVVERKFDEWGEDRQNFAERWNALKQYKCDPWGELKTFETRLERDPAYKPTVSEEHAFDLGRIFIHRSFASSDTEALIGYNFLRYCEELGIAFKMDIVDFGSSTANGAIKRISRYSPNWAIATLFRTGDSNMVDSMFSRESIFQTPKTEIDVLVKQYVLALRTAKSELGMAQPSSSQNLALKLAAIVPEALSRLCVKCSEESRELMLALVKDFYLSDNKQSYKNVRDLISRLLISWSGRQIYERLPELLDFPILSGLHPFEEMDYPDPFSFFSMTRQNAAHFKPMSIGPPIIDTLIKKAGSSVKEERERSILRLVKLYQAGLLGKDQQERFSETLWSQVDDQFGFPVNRSYYKFAFLNLPHPSRIDPVRLFKEYVEKAMFPIQGNKKEVEIRQGSVMLCDEILGATRQPNTPGEVFIEWSSEEVGSMLIRLAEWWDADKARLGQKEGSNGFGSIAIEFKARFANIVNILRDVIIPRLTPDSPQKLKQEISRLIDEMNQMDVVCISAAAASLVVFPDRATEVFGSLDRHIGTADKEKVVDSLKGIFSILALQNRGKLPESPNIVWELISQKIKWRKMPGLSEALSTVRNIVREMGDLIPKATLQEVLLALEFLLHDTDLGANDSPIVNLADRFDCRAAAAALAHALWDYYSRRAASVPEVISKWREISHSEEEFAEIRNEWED